MASSAAELDSVPGGMGFVGAMANAYCELGHRGRRRRRRDGRRLRRDARCDGRRTSIRASRSSSPKSPPTTATSWIGSLPACGPSASSRRTSARRKTIVFTEEALFIRHEDGHEDRIDVIYRNFELFDLLNVPKQELILYAARHNRVKTDAAAEGAARGKVGVRAAASSAARAAVAQGAGRRACTRGCARSFRRPGSSIRVRCRRKRRSSGLHRQRPAGRMTGCSWKRSAKASATTSSSRRASASWPGARAACTSPTISPARSGRAALVEGLAAFERTPYILQRFHKGRRVRVDYFDPRATAICARWTAACA